MINFKTIKKWVSVSIAMGFLLGGSTVLAEHKQGRQIFKKWNEFQEVYSDVNFSEYKKDLGDSFFKKFRNIYENNFALLSKMTPFLKVFTNGQINENGYQLTLPMDKEIVDKFATLYDLFDTDMPGFIDFLLQSNFATANISSEEPKTHFDLVINKYKAFFQLMVPQLDGYAQEQALFGLANRLFEYCFENKSFDHYQELLSHASSYPIARFLNAAMWYHLVGDGWKHWHQNCLDVVKERANNGCEVVYIAGGTDIYQLLRQGIYNVHVIDPFLPTQVRYYSEGWSWLLKGIGENGGLGDTITMSFEKRNITMKRIAYSEGDKFNFKGSNNQILELKKSVTVWSVYDAKNNQLGNITFDRRLVRQEDFDYFADKTILFSYDEAVCISSPDILNGWGIDPTKFSDDLHVFVKQLRKPLTKDILCNMRVLSMMNLADLKFINFASDPT